MDIYTTPAGEHLDYLIGNEVFGYRPDSRTWSAEAIANWPPPYSTDMSAAWILVEAMAPKRLKLIQFTDGWYASFTDEDIASAPWSVSQCPDAALAICRAALKAVSP